MDYHESREDSSRDAGQDDAGREHAATAVS
jgi:hypothetical protein